MSYFLQYYNAADTILQTDKLSFFNHMSKMNVILSL